MINNTYLEQLLHDITEVKKDKGYVYAYPPKRSWVAIDKATQFVIDSWDGGNYSGDLGIYLHVPFCPPRRTPQTIKKKFLI